MGVRLCRAEVDEARQAAEAATAESARRSASMDARLEAAASAAADAERRAAEAAAVSSFLLFKQAEGRQLRMALLALCQRCHGPNLSLMLMQMCFHSHSCFDVICNGHSHMPDRRRRSLRQRCCRQRLRRRSRPMQRRTLGCGCSWLLRCCSWQQPCPGAAAALEAPPQPPARRKRPSDGSACWGVSPPTPATAATPTARCAHLGSLSSAVDQFARVSGGVRRVASHPTACGRPISDQKDGRSDRR